MSKSNKDIQAIFESQQAEIKQLYQTIENLKVEYEAKVFNLQNILDVIPGSIYWKNKDGVYLGRNKFSEDKMRSAGLSTESVAHKTDYDFFPKSIADRYRQNDLEVMEKEIEFTREEEVTLTNGEKIIQLSSKRPLYDQFGKVCGIVGNTVDITYLKKIENELRAAKEKAEIANKIKTEFIHNMEHDIRTPLSGIFGVVNALQEEEELPEKKQLLEETSIATKELLNYCNSVLDLSQLEAGELPVYEKKIDFIKIAQDTIALEVPSVHMKQLKLQQDFSKQQSLMIMSDDFRLSRILLNLLGNAIKFTEKGSVSIIVKKLKKLSNRKAILIFSIRDTGIGIHPDQQGLIFEKFIRGTSSNKGLYKGVGLGLHIVKQFVNDLNGDIELQSKEKDGSIFTCHIPVKLPL